jgi:hypothetical protein
MALVQAYRRNKTYTHTFADAVLVFKPNEKGDVVCDVPDQSAVDRLLLIPTGFRLYGEQADEPASSLLTQKLEHVPESEQGEPKTEPKDDAALEHVPENASPYVLKDEASGIEFDLRPLSDEELHEFAKANDVKVHPKAKGDTIRNKIVQSFKE